MKECRDKCAEYLEVGYFTIGTNKYYEYCTCYTTAAGCPDDDLFPDYNSYSILRKGKYCNKLKLVNILFSAVIFYAVFQIFYILFATFRMQR